MAAFEFTSFFPLPSVFCSEHLPLHDASPRHSDPGQHENNRRSGLRAGGSERVCQEEQQRKWLRYTFSEDVVCLERLLPGEGTLVQIIVFDGTKYIVKEGKVWLNLTLLLKKKPLQNEPFLACFAHTILRVTFCSQCSPRRRRRDDYLSRPLPFSVVAPSRQIKHTFRAPAKQASKALSGNNFKKTCSDSQWGKTELNGTSLHLFYGFTLWSLFCFVFRVTCGGIRMVPLVFKANLALVPTQAELPRSCSSSCMLLEFLSTQGDLSFMNAFVETNKFPFQNNHVIWDSFYKLKEQLVEEKVNRSPSLTSSVRCGFRPVVSFQLRGWVWWSDSFSFEKKAFQTGQLHIAVMDTRVNISASVFGTFTCGFYYLKSTRPI